MNTLIALVGMPGSGKSIVADYLVTKGYLYLRMGQITLDEVKKRGIAPSEENERVIREEFRRLHGMGAFATLNLAKITSLLKKGDVVIDNLMSWSEYKVFEEKFSKNFICIAVLASPKTRYDRLGKRKHDALRDPHMRFRQASFVQARSRDFSEIENIEKGGPIAMADYYIINEGDKGALYSSVDKVLYELKR